MSVTDPSLSNRDLCPTTPSHRTIALMRLDAPAAIGGKVRAKASVEVVRAHFGAGDIERNNLPRFHVDDAILKLEQPIDAQNAAARDDESVGLENIGLDDYVGNAGFVLDREKNEALRSAGPLTGNHASGNADIPMIRTAFEFRCR